LSWAALAVDGITVRGALAVEKYVATASMSARVRGYAKFRMTGFARSPLA
jgi:hypothetical protein